MKALFDTSSLLSIGLIGLLESTLDILDIHTTSVVGEELKEIAKIDDEKGRVATRILGLMSKGMIKVIDPVPKVYKKYLSRYVEDGEASCFSACVNEGIKILITNDIDAAWGLRNAAKLNNIDIKICLAVIVELIKKGKLSKKSGYKKIRKLTKIRGWEGGVIEVLAEKYVGKNEIGNATQSRRPGRPSQKTFEKES